MVDGWSVGGGVPFSGIAVVACLLGFLFCFAGLYWGNAVLEGWGAVCRIIGMNI